MQAVKPKDTRPELIVRRFLHSRGYRYRLHRKDLPGTPDIAFMSLRKAIFIHGCFWHGHDCPKGRLPKSHLEYWQTKLERNKKRDRENTEKLRSLGWDVLVVWQCQTVDIEALALHFQEFLGNREM